MPDEDTLAAFAEWLEEDYAESTVRKFCADISTMATWGPAPPAAKRLKLRVQDYRLAWSRWDAFCTETDVENGLPEPQPLERRFGRRRRKDAARLKPALSIPESSWDALRERIRSDPSPQSRVLDVLVCSGLRIGDVLRLTEPLLRSALEREDGIGILRVKGARDVVFTTRDGSDSWARLYELLQKDQRVAAICSKTDDPQAAGASYQACRRALKAHAEAVGLEAREIHLHRTRRTVAVQLYKAGVRIEIISKVLQHQSIETTQRYLDESMADVAGKALARLNSR